MDPSMRKLRLLSFDGGGVRGLSSLYLLKQTMEIAGQADRKPCEVFDMIGGTSTGGLIAIMLGHLEMTIKECIDAYYSVMKSVFTKKGPGLNWRGKVVGQYDTKELEAAIKRIIMATGAPENQLFRTPTQSGCKVIVCASSLQFSQNAVRFTNYSVPGEAGSDFYNECRTWEVARATSAAPSYFDPIDIGRNKRRFGDGAFHYNNPIEEVWRSAIEQWDKDSNVAFEDRVASCLSLGTGVPSDRKMGDTPVALMKSLAKISLETEETAKRFHNQHPKLAANNRYLRLNVQQGLKEVGLAETKQCNIIEEATETYGNLPLTRTQIDNFVKTLPEIPDSKQLIPLDSQRPSTTVLEAIFTAPSERVIDPRAHYWLHMTEGDMERFETAHKILPHNANGSIECELVLLLQLDGSSGTDCCLFTDHSGQVLRDEFALLSAKCPSAFAFYDVCSRLRTQPGIFPPLSKQHFLAILYMLRVEYCFQVEPPMTPQGRFHLSDDRILAINSIDKWVSCVCNCHRRWNFINNRGLVICPLSVKPERQCQAERFLLDAKPSKTVRKLYNANQDKWARV